jgi:DNA adenine methylase
MEPVYGCETTLLRWAGSKRKLVPNLLRAIPSAFSRYIEPFAGSACLFFTLKPSSAILSDFNEQLMLTYRIIRDYPCRLAALVHGMPKTEPFYYELRRSKPSNELFLAARFVYLNRFCFNGVYRTNRAGEFNVPRGERTGLLPSVSCFGDAARVLSKAELRIGDFENSIADVAKGDFVYLDPPYTTASRRYSGEYGYGAFAEKDLERLVKSLRLIDRRGARFLLSYRYLPGSHVFLEWFSKRVRTRRHVAGFSKHRRLVSELLVANYPFPA